MTDTQQLGKYEILEEIGKGGFATVYRARDTVLGREVALKVLDPLLMRDEAFVERFKHEAQAAAVLQHPNLVTILGEAEGRVYIAEEYLPGGDLRQRLAKGPLPLSEASAVVEQIGAALDYAHEQRMVHRDVKPANILFDTRGQAKLSDFGIARALSGTRFTTTGAALGTPEYMAPEQAEGKEVDRRTDLYALAVVAYEMVTGRVPFTGDTPSTIHYRHVHEQPPPPHEVQPALPVEVSGVLLKALAKRPDDRYATCADLAAALREAILQGEQAYWSRSLAEVERLLESGELAQATERIEHLSRRRPGDPVLERLRARIQEEQALAAAYAEAREHWQTAVDKAGQVLAQRADYPDRDGVFEALQLRGKMPRQQRQQRSPQIAAVGIQPVSGALAQASVVRTTAWLLLALSIQFGLLAYGTGIIGIVGAIGMLKGRAWGRKVGLAFAVLLEAAGFVAAVAMVGSLANVWYTVALDLPVGWSIAPLVGMSVGIILAYLLCRESVVRGLGEEPKNPAGAWPIAVPLWLTQIGLIPAIGLLFNKNWGRVAAMVVVGLFALTLTVAVGLYALTLIVGAVLARPEIHSEGVIAGIEAMVVVGWCIVAIIYLASPGVKAWFQGNSGGSAQ